MLFHQFNYARHRVWMLQQDVWALADNARACAFYEGLGGVPGPEGFERVSGFSLPKIVYLFT